MPSCLNNSVKLDVKKKTSSASWAEIQGFTGKELRLFQGENVTPPSPITQEKCYICKMSNIIKSRLMRPVMITSKERIVALAFKLDQRYVNVHDVCSDLLLCLELEYLWSNLLDCLKESLKTTSALFPSELKTLSKKSVKTHGWLQHSSQTEADALCKPQTATVFQLEPQQSAEWWCNSRWSSAWSAFNLISLEQNIWMALSL